MLLDILLMVGTLEKAIGNSVKIAFSTYERDAVFPTGLTIMAEWIVERQLIRVQDVIPATELEKANSTTELEAFLLQRFVSKAKAGYEKKLHEMRNRVEQEIRNAAKT